MASTGDKYGEDRFRESELILKLLAEYTEKLKIVVERQSALRQRNYTFLLVAILLPGVLIVAIESLLSSLDSSGFPADSSGFPALGSVLWAIVVISALLALVASIYFYFVGRRRFITVEYEVGLLIRQLDELVHTASQLEEHTKLDRAHRLEFRLRLIEAQGAFDLAQRSVHPDKTSRA